MTSWIDPFFTRLTLPPVANQLLESQSFTGGLYRRILPARRLAGLRAC